MLVEKQRLAPNLSERLLVRSTHLLNFSSRNAVVLLALVAIFLRLIFILAMPGINDPNNMDTQAYLELAQHLVEGRGYIMWDKPSIFVAPLYPTLLAGLRLVCGDSILAIKIFQAILGGISVWLVYLLGREFFQPPIAYIAAAFFAFHPEMIALAAFIYTEVIFIFFLLLTLLFAIKAVRTRRPAFFLLAGVFLGMANLCRGTLMYFPAFLLLLLLFYRDTFWRRRLLGGAALALAMALTMLPWTIRNYIHFHAIVPVAIGGGDVFWTGNYLPFDGEYRYEETQKKIEELVGNATLTERDRILMAEAKKSIATHPWRSAWLFVRKIFRYWFRVYENVPQGHSRQTNWLILSVLGTVHFALLAFAVAGFWRANLREPIIGVMLLLFFYYTVVHAATLAVPRYRQPLIPTLCIWAAAGIWTLRGKWSLSKR